MQPFDSSCDDNGDTTETTPALRRRRPFKKERSGVRSSSVFLPRFVKRNLPFHQSRNNVRVKNVNSKKLWKLWAIDWFHSLLRLPSYISVPFLLTFWVSFVVIFAAIYMHVDQLDAQTDCGLGDVGSPIGFPGAFAFSLETCTTVGYGLPGSTNGFFEQDCGMLQMTIFVQMLWSMMFNAFLFAFFYSLLSKSEFRSSQIVFTSKLIINQKGGKVFARLQCFDIDSAYPLVDAHARMFLLDAKMKMTSLRLCDPDDERGAAIYPSVPADIVHHIDHHSPLSPRQLPLVRKASVLALRSLDSYTCNREEVICPVCGEGYGTYERLKAHVEYTAMVDERENFQTEKSHAGFVVPEIQPLTLDEVREHIEKTLSEIVVVIEAVDPQLSGGFQSLQSYKYDDIEFGCEFSDCILSQRNDSFVVDMEKFHGLVYRSDCNGNSQDIQKLLQREDSSASLSTISEGSSEPATEQRGYLRRSYNTFQSTSERIKEFTSNTLDIG